MSHNGQIYRIYPDDKTDHTSEDWAKADRWLNGLQYSADFKEAISLAKLGYVNCKFPFIVMRIPIGGKRKKICDCWIIES